jgi:AcrR family transcriptional regulator
MSVDRPLRADAMRNRDRLLCSAGEAFAAHGIDAPLDDIARGAEVGIGTLYRHFPTRSALVEAVFRRQVEELCDAADTLLRAEPPGESLRSWLQRLVEYAANKRGMGPALKSVLGPECDLFSYTHNRVRDAAASLVDAGVEAGVVRADIDPMDLLRAVSGISVTAHESGGRERAQRLVDLLMDGMQCVPVSRRAR